MTGTPWKYAAVFAAIGVSEWSILAATLTSISDFTYALVKSDAKSGQSWGPLNVPIVPYMALAAS